MPYLFVHFKEKLTPDGEQVYFAKSKDGYYWNEVNDGNPVLSAHLGECGCRDVEIIRLKNNGFVIFTTDIVDPPHLHKVFLSVYTKSARNAISSRI